MTARIPPELKESYAKRRVPMRRYADAEEVAQGESHSMPSCVIVASRADH
jgi:hypothetical protein